MACRSKHGNAHVRIGITGTGRFPSHKIVYASADGAETLFCAYAERTHFTETIHEHTWSSNRMSLDEVRALLGEMSYVPSSAASRAKAEIPPAATRTANENAKILFFNRQPIKFPIRKQCGMIPISQWYRVP
jgi:hypothetical protein